MRPDVSNNTAKTTVILFVIISFVLSPFLTSPVKAQEANTPILGSGSKLEIKQEGIFHLNSYRGEILTFPLDIIEPEENVQYFWDAMLTPTQREVASIADGANIEASYISQTDFTGTNIFTMQVLDSTGKEADINLIIALGQIFSSSPSHFLSSQNNTLDQLDLGLDREIRTDLYIGVMLNSDNIFVFNCTPTAEVTLIIDSNTPWIGQCENDGNMEFFVHPFDIQPGQTVTVSDGTNQTTHVVRSLAIEETNLETDIILGTADPESSVTVSAAQNYLSPFRNLDLSVDSSGNWLADFSGLVDLQVRSPGYVIQYDEFGNRTELYFRIPYSLIFLY